MLATHHLSNNRVSPADLSLDLMQVKTIELIISRIISVFTPGLRLNDHEMFSHMLRSEEWVQLIGYR